MRYPEEITESYREECDHLQKVLDVPGEMMISVFVGEDLAGNASIHSLGGKKKLSHRAEFGIAVKKNYWHRGMGRLLLHEVLQQARAMGYEQLELGVYADNERARRLYKQMGFEEWGTTPHAFKLKDGTYCDEIRMGIRFK